MSDLRTKVLVKVSDFQTRTNVNPKKLLLGFTEWHQLRALAHDAGFSLKEAIGNRPEFNGLSVYQVDDINYVEVAP